MDRDKLQNLIIEISEKNGIGMSYTVSGKIADKIMEENAKERKSAEVKDA